jgi:photosystem II stability/assembly factor-like uncharacterized protein
MKQLIKVVTLLSLWIGLAAPVVGSPDPVNTWVQTSTNMTSGADVGGFAFSPNYAVDHTVFAATYAGVFKSTDGGLTWWGCTSVLNQHFSSLAFSPNYASDHILIAGHSYGVRKTSDGGTTWPDINTDLPTESRNILVVAFSPDYANDQTFFAGTRDSGLFKAADINAPHWTPAGSLPYSLNSRITSLVFSPGYAADQVIFVGSGLGDIRPGYGGGIYKSNDKGVTWTAVSAWLPEPSHRTVLTLVISPNYQNDHTVFAGLFAAGVYKSTDGGNNWVLLPGTRNLTIQSLVISPNFAVDGTVFAGGSSACYLTTDGGNSWRTLNAGFGGYKSILTLAIPPNQINQPFNVFAGMSGDRVWQMLYQDLRIFLPLVIR